MNKDRDKEFVINNLYIDNANKEPLSLYHYYNMCKVN